MDNKQLPCPFCGGEELCEMPNGPIPIVWCCNCEARGPRISGSTNQSFIGDWNTRGGNKFNEKLNYYESKYTCPHCGCENGYASDLTENKGVDECDDCRKEFFYQIVTSVTYMTRKDP